MINKIIKVSPEKISTTHELILKTLNHNWKIKTLTNSNLLHRRLEFVNYEQTQAFLTQVSMRAHLYGHHPTIVNTYTKVDVFLTTHDENNGEITDIDIKFAKRIDSIVADWKLKDFNGSQINKDVDHSGIFN